MTTSVVPELEKLRTQIDQRIERTYAARQKLADELAALLKRGAPVSAAQREALMRAIDRYLKTQAAFHDAAADLAVGQQEIARLERVHDYQVAVLRKKLHDTHDPAIDELRQQIDALANDNGAAWALNATREVIIARGTALRAARARLDAMKEEPLDDAELAEALEAVKSGVRKTGVDL